MGAGLEPLTSLLRVGPDYHGYGDPYKLSASIVWLSPVEVEIRGLSSIDSDPDRDGEQIRPSHWRDIRNCLLAAGAKRVKFKRVRGDGAEEWHEVITEKG